MCFVHLTCKRASRHNGVQFFISHLASWLRTRRFSEPTLRPSGATNHWKNTVFRDFPTFSRICICFLLTLSLLLFFLLIFLFSLPLPCSAFHLSILSEVWLLNFLRSCIYMYIYIYISTCLFNMFFCYPIDRSYISVSVRYRATCCTRQAKHPKPRWEAERLDLPRRQRTTRRTTDKRFDKQFDKDVSPRFTTSNAHWPFILFQVSSIALTCPSTCPHYHFIALMRTWNCRWTWTLWWDSNCEQVLRRDWRWLEMTGASRRCQVLCWLCWGADGRRFWHHADLGSLARCKTQCKMTGPTGGPTGSRRGRNTPWYQWYQWYDTDMIQIWHI